MIISLHKADDRLPIFLDAICEIFPYLGAQARELEGKNKHGIYVEIEAIKPDQTDTQRGYYHMSKKQFADWVGMTPDELHEHILREAYGSELVETRLGEVRRPLQRSSEANREEYSQLIETLIRVAADVGFTIPPPLRHL